VEAEITALRLVASLLSDHTIFGDNRNPIAATPIAATEPVQVSVAINALPRPDTHLGWKERDGRWP
jgi:hypothetical protein